MMNAADHIAANGIACTSQLEHTLFDEMNGLCRTLMGMVIKEAATNYEHSEPEPGERHGGVHEKKIVTLFGETPPIKRVYFYDEDEKKGRFPFDEKLGLIGRYTPAVANECCRYAVDSPYKDAAAKFSSCHGFSISADTVRSMVDHRRNPLAGFLKDKDWEKPENARETQDIVCVMGDGTGIPMRKSSLQGAKGKNGAARTREVKAGSIFIASKTSDNKPHRNIDTTTYVTTTNRVEKFGKLLRSEFDRRFEKSPETVLFISDGAAWLKTVHDNHFAMSTMILDCYHGLEHLKPMMLGMGYKEGTKEWKRKHAYWTKRIKDGKIKNLLDSIWEKEKDKLGTDAMREYKYFRSHADFMKYDVYRANGWFIGSGVIESGCKTVVGQRFKQSGMFWSLKGAKPLLSLRALHKSGRLESFFRYTIKDLEQVRCVA